LLDHERFSARLGLSQTHFPLESDLRFRLISRWTRLLFADVQNIYYTTRQTYGRQFSYRKLWRQIASNGDIIFATAYATQRDDDKQLKFQNALKHIGFDIKLKPYIQRSDGSAKGD